MKFYSVLFLALYVLTANNASADLIDYFKYDGSNERECRILGGWIGRYDGNRAAGNAAEAEQKVLDQMNLIRNNCKENKFEIFEDNYQLNFHKYSKRNLDTENNQ